MMTHSSIRQGSIISSPAEDGRRVFFHVATVLALMLFSTLTAAADATREEKREFNIPQQRADLSLTKFAEQADLTLIFRFKSVKKKTANRLEGSYSVNEAIDLLLAGTGLQPVFSDQGLLMSVSDNESEAEGEAMSVKKKAGLGALLVGLFSIGANAQEPAETDTDEAERQLEEIIVTGSRIRGAQNASPVMTISRQDIERGGFATVEEIVDKLPQNFGAGATQDTVTGFDSSDAVGSQVGNITSGTSVNLRGLGASSTLILLNGRRLSPSGNTAAFTDISNIPVTAIERVEVLTDGASAIYGSDAIGGVVNFILRDDYEGAETRLRYGSDSGGDATDVLFGQSFGNSWESGHALVTYEFYKHDGLANRDRAFASSRDLTRFGGDDFRIAGGNPANIFPGDFSAFLAIPPGQDGTSLTAADFDANAPLNLHDRRTHEDLLPEQERHSAFVHLTQDIGSVEVFSEAGFSTRDNLNRIDQNLLFLFVTDANPFFVDPTGTGQTSAFIADYSLTDNVGPQILSGETDTIRGVLGANFDIGDTWRGELVGNWTKEDATQKLDNAISSTAVNDAVNQSDPSLALNVFGDGSAINPAILPALVSSEILTEVENELWTLGFNIDGEAFDISGGAVKVAAGIEYREESLVNQIGSGIEAERDVLAVYAELFFPLVSTENGRPGIQRLEVSVAARYEDYSDFGDSTNPKIGVVWSPTESLTFRGTYGTSFRAPSLFDSAPDSPANRINYLPSPFPSPMPALVLLGGNPTLKAEEATTWTAGLQWTPESIRGFSLDVTYFDIDFDDRIDVPFVSLVVGANDPRFTSLIDTMPTAEEIAALVNGPLYQESSFGITTPAADIISGVIPVNWILDARTNNISRSVVTGTELQLSYDFDTNFGSFNLGLNGNYLFDFQRALIIADPLVEEVDTLGRPVDFRARGNVTWARKAWVITGFVNYADGYTDNVSDPVRSIDSWTTLDLTVSYDVGNSSGFFGDTRLSLTTQNLFDEDPPFVNTFTGAGYDTSVASPLGRFVSFQITKEW